MTVPLDYLGVRPYLGGRFGVPLFIYVERCRSTQDLFPEDASEGALALAEEQSGGRGRLGRVWEAGSGTSLLFSLCLRPQVEIARLPTLTIVFAEAIVSAIAEVSGAEAHIKEPNDVLVSGKKVAGVIAEAAGGRVVLGAGINVSQGEGDLPERPIYPATSLLLETGTVVDRALLLAHVLMQLERRYELWLAG